MKIHMPARLSLYHFISEVIGVIRGIGTDIVDIRRIKKAIENPRFLREIYTEEEISQTKGRPASLAGNFAVKEAVSKALGTGFRGFGPRQIEVLRMDSGAPYVRLFGEAWKQMKKQNIDRIFVSMSHEADYAVAYAVAESDGEEAGI